MRIKLEGQDIHDVAALFGRTPPLASYGLAVSSCSWENGYETHHLLG